MNQITLHDLIVAYRSDEILQLFFEILKNKNLSAVGNVTSIIDKKQLTSMSALYLFSRCAIRWALLFAFVRIPGTELQSDVKPCSPMSDVDGNQQRVSA